ncbi:MAG: glycosyltransferase [Parvularculaceae bacterium]|nr:glycosyltransferase [Parvularculaceae bacterium]
MTDGTELATSRRLASGLRVFFVAYHAPPHDARFLKLRRSFIGAGAVVGAAAPSLGPLAEGVTPVDPGPASTGRWSAFLRARRITQGILRAGGAFRPELIYVFDPEALPAALALKRRSGARLLYDAHEFHEAEDPSAPERGAWVRKTERAASAEIDAFVTVNASIARLYAEAQPTLAKAIVVRNAVEAGRVAPYDGRLHEASGAPRERRLLLYQGGLAKMRGLDRLVAAAPLLGPDWMLVIMGDGPLGPSLKAAADPARVRFMPPVPHIDLPAWTSGASLGAVLYEDIGLNQHFCSPNKLWEYPHAGVPLLASDLPELARVARGLGCGVLVPPDAPPATIAAAVNDLKDADLARARAACAAFSASETWESEIAPALDFAQRLRP